MSVRFQIAGGDESPNDTDKQRVGFRGVSDIEEEPEVVAEESLDEEEELSPRTATSQSLASDVDYYMDNESVEVEHDEEFVEKMKRTNQFYTLCDGVHSALALVHSALQNYLEFKDDLIKYDIPSSVLLKLSTVSSQLYRSISDLHFPVQELIRMVRSYSSLWEGKSQALKTLYENYARREAQLRIAIAKLSASEAVARRAHAERSRHNWALLFARINAGPTDEERQQLSRAQALSEGEAANEGETDAGTSGVATAQPTARKEPADPKLLAEYAQVGRRWKFRLHDFKLKAEKGLEYAREFFIDPAEEEAEAAELAKRMEMEKAARLLAGDEEKSDGSEEAGSEAGGGDEQRQAVALLPDAATGQDAEMMRELQKRAMDEGETSPQKAQSPSLSSRRLSELDEDDEAGRQNRMGRRRSTLAVDEERSMVRISKEEYERLSERVVAKEAPVMAENGMDTSAPTFEVELRCRVFRPVGLQGHGFHTVVTYAPTKTILKSEQLDPPFLGEDDEDSEEENDSKVDKKSRKASIETIKKEKRKKRAKQLQKFHEFRFPLSNLPPSNVTPSAEDSGDQPPAQPNAQFHFAMYRGEENALVGFSGIEIDDLDTIDIPTHVDDPGPEKAMLEEAPVDSDSDLGAEAGAGDVGSSLFSGRKGSGASAASLLSLPDAQPHPRASGTVKREPLWTGAPELPDELVRLTPFPIYSADALIAESRAPIGELPLFFYWYRRAVYPLKTTSVETDALFKLVLQLTGIDVRVTSTEELLARAQKRDVCVSPIPWPESEKPKKSSRPSSGPSQVEASPAAAAAEEEPQDVIPRAEHQRIVDELQQKLVDMQSQQQERLQSLLSSLGPTGSAGTGAPPEQAAAPAFPARRGVKAAAGAGVGARKAGAKEARAPTTSSMSDLFNYGDRVKAELQRKSALADDSYPTVKHRYKKNFMIDQPLPKWGEGLSEDFLERLDYFNEHSEQHRRANESEVREQMRAMIERQLADLHRLDLRAQPSRQPPAAPGPERAHSALGAIRSDPDISEVCLPALFMPVTGGPNATVYNPRAHAFFHPNGYRGVRVTQPPSALELPQIPQHISLLNFYDLERRYYEVRRMERALGPHPKQQRAPRAPGGPLQPPTASAGALSDMPSAPPPSQPAPPPSVAPNSALTATMAHSAT